MNKRINNKHPDAVKQLTNHGMHHNLPDKVVSRFYGTIETPVRISECRIFRDVYFEDADKADNSIVTKPGKTVIGHDVWVGYGAYIRNGVTIGDGAVIGARSVVTKDVPPYGVVVGHPAKIVKYRFEEPMIERLMTLKWWRFAPWQLRDVTFSRIEQAVDELEVFVATDPEPYVPGLIELHR